MGSNSMRKLYLLVLMWFTGVVGYAQSPTAPDFVWGNTGYFNVNNEDTVHLSEVEISFLRSDGLLNYLTINGDSLPLKVARQNPAEVRHGISFFIADNQCLQQLPGGEKVHDILTGEALLAIAGNEMEMLDPEKFVFPVSFSSGFIWRYDQGLPFYHFHKCPESHSKQTEGLLIDCTPLRNGNEHRIIAMEDCRVVWVHMSGIGAHRNACILLQSNSNQSIFYVYDRLSVKNLQVKRGQQVEAGEFISTPYAGQLQLAVLYSDTIPAYEQRYRRSFNCFPQLFALYNYPKKYIPNRVFTKGRIRFGSNQPGPGRYQNTSSFENFLGKGWIIDSRNGFGRVELAVKGEVCNARLRKALFASVSASCVQPQPHYDYEICVRNGVYRVRSLVGDAEQDSWQQLEFEGRAAGIHSLKAGEFKWTPERIVKVKDGRLTTRMVLDSLGGKVAGIREVVFQQVY